MTSDPRKQQRREWVYLYDRIREVLRRFGEEDDYPGRKDYWLVNENWGLWQHRIETSNLEMVRPVVVKSLQKLLQGYSNWEISIAVTSPEADDAWPTMGLVISEDEIVDGLQRQYFPEQFRTIAYEGSRPQGSRFHDIIYLGLKPF
jgi:hypothetical protein